MPWRDPATVCNTCHSRPSPSPPLPPATARRTRRSGSEILQAERGGVTAEERGASGAAQRALGNVQDLWCRCWCGDDGKCEQTCGNYWVFSYGGSSSSLGNIELEGLFLFWISSFVQAVFLDIRYLLHLKIFSGFKKLFTLKGYILLWIIISAFKNIFCL